ncbi:hypothetical protein RI367_003199 [Sorochytrium milnesiophthora]
MAAATAQASLSFREFADCSSRGPAGRADHDKEQRRRRQQQQQQREQQYSDDVFEFALLEAAMASGSLCLFGDKGSTTSNADQALREQDDKTAARKETGTETATRRLRMLVQHLASGPEALSFAMSLPLWATRQGSNIAAWRPPWQ